MTDHPAAHSADTRAEEAEESWFDTLSSCAGYALIGLLVTSCVWVPVLSNITDRVMELRVRSRYAHVIAECRTRLDWTIEPALDLTHEYIVDMERYVQARSGFGAGSFAGKVYICKENGKPLGWTTNSLPNFSHKSYISHDETEIGTVVFVRVTKTDTGRYKRVFVGSGNDAGPSQSGTRVTYDIYIIERATGQRMRVILSPPMPSDSMYNTTQLQEQI